MKTTNLIQRTIQGMATSHSITRLLQINRIGLKLLRKMPASMCKVYHRVLRRVWMKIQLKMVMAKSKGSLITWGQWILRELKRRIQRVVDHMHRPHQTQVEHLEGGFLLE